MRILFDECLDWRLLRDLNDHDVQTVKQLGWEAVKNGALLRLAATQFDLRELLPELSEALRHPRKGEFQFLSWRSLV